MDNEETAVVETTASENNEETTTEMTPEPASPETTAAKKAVKPKATKKAAPKADKPAATKKAAPKAKAEKKPAKAKAEKPVKEETKYRLAAGVKTDQIRSKAIVAVVDIFKKANNKAMTVQEVVDAAPKDFPSKNLKSMISYRVRCTPDVFTEVK